MDESKASLYRCNEGLERSHEPLDPSNPPLNRFMALCTRTTSRCTGTASLLAKARAAEAGAVLVACLDLSGVVRFAETELPIVDAADCLAREIVRRWMSGRQERHLPRRS